MKKFALMLGGLLALGVAGTSRAELTFNIWESGGDVIAVSSGNVNTAGLTQHGTSGWLGAVRGEWATVVVGPASAPGSNTIYYSGVSGPSSFGSGARQFANSGTGQIFGLVNYFKALYLPVGYVSGSALSGTSTWNSNTLAGLGLTAGTYNFTWGSGANADHATVIIGSAPVPEPSSIIMAGMGVVGAITLARKRKLATA